MTPTERARRITLALGRRGVTADEARRMTPRQQMLAAWAAGVLPLAETEWRGVVALLGLWESVGEVTTDKTAAPACDADAATTA